MKSHNTNEALIDPGTRYKGHSYNLVAKSIPSGIPARPFTGLTRIHIRWNKHYAKYLVKSYRNAGNLVLSVIGYELPSPCTLDHLIDHLVNKQGFKIII